MEPWSRAATCARPAVQAPEQPWAQPQAAEQRQGSRSPRAGVKPADHGIAVGEALSEQSLRHDTGTPRRPPPPAPRHKDAPPPTAASGGSASPWAPCLPARGLLLVAADPALCEPHGGGREQRPDSHPVPPTPRQAVSAPSDTVRCRNERDARVAQCEGGRSAVP